MYFWKLVWYGVISLFAAFTVPLLIDPSGNNPWSALPSLAVGMGVFLFLRWREFNQAPSTPQPNRTEKLLFSGMLGVVVGLFTFKLIGLSTSLIIGGIVMVLAYKKYPWHKIRYELRQPN